MRIDRFLLQRRILDLKSRDFPSVLDELLAVALPEGTPPERRQKVRAVLIEREAQMQRRVGEWASLPNIQTSTVEQAVVAIGRLPVASAAPVASEKKSSESAAPATSPTKNSSETAPAKESQQPLLRVVFLILVPSKWRNYHLMLSELVQAVENCGPRAIDAASDLKSFRALMMKIFRGASETSLSQGSTWNRRFAKTASNLAKLTHCQVLLFFADTFAEPIPFEDQKTTAFRSIIVSGKKKEITLPSGAKPEIINVSSFAKHRMSQLRAALFVGLMRGSIKPTDRVCCLGGSDGSDKLDSLIIVEVAQEFPSKMVTEADALVPQHVRPEVIERAIGIATELAVVGREGKPVGTMIVIGDTEKITPYVEQLVMNPFSGYRTDDRNLLNPFVEETIMEFAQIDGAFVVDGNGVVHSAGSRLTAVDSQLSLQSGLGTRHAAAAAISSVADCAAVCASSSGQVTLFRHGEAIVLLDRSVSRTL